MTPTSVTASGARNCAWWRRVGWAHLVYLGIPAFQPAFDPSPERWEWGLYGVIVLLAVPLYLVPWLRPDRALWGSMVPMTVLGALTVPFNTGAGVLFVYTAATAGISEPRRVAVRWFSGLTLLLGTLTMLSTVAMPWRLWGVIPSVLFVWIIGFTQMEHAESERDATELRSRLARIEHLATVAERERMARELHDLLGHSLTAVIMRAQLVRQLVGVDPERARSVAGEVEDTARHALSEMRSAVGGWRHATVDGELESARDALSSVGMRLTVERDSDLTLVSSTEHELALVLREAVTNVVRHSGARTCHVGLRAERGELRMTISDDGVGGRFREGNGMAGIRERVTAVGGELSRRSSSGTTLTVTLPLEVAV